MTLDIMLSAFPAALPQSGTAAVILTVVSILLNLAVCFFGFRLFKVLVTILGFLGGVCLGLAAMFQVDRPVWSKVLLALLPGILLAVLALKIYKVGVFLFCGLLPGVLLTVTLGTWIGLIAFLVFGVLGVLLPRFYIIAVTSVSSGLLVGQQLLALISLSNAVAAAVVGLVLAVLGFVFQWKTTKKVDPQTGAPSC